MDKELIQKCYEKSIELLLNNSSGFGVLASSESERAKSRDYLSIFGRDASICSLGMIASGNKKLIETAKKSLETLAKHQAENGQIPNYVRARDEYTNFWYFGCIDATLWWLIALKFYNDNSGDKVLYKKFKLEVEKAINWLLCQEHQKDFLIMQNEASDWADIMPRSGKVLYSNVLWLKVKELYKIKNFGETKNSFNYTFYPFKENKNKVDIFNLILRKEILKKQKSTNYYLSFVNYYFWGKDVDVYANSLAVWFGYSNEALTKRITNFLTKKSRKNSPIPVVFKPIKKRSKLWRGYMAVHSQNFPYQYHNGGIWPYASCFWSLALHKVHKKEQAWKELEKIAKFNQVNDWEFNEWFHGKTGKPKGMKGQSWNAAMFVFTYHYLNNQIKL